MLSIFSLLLTIKLQYSKIFERGKLKCVVYNLRNKTVHWRQMFLFQFKECHNQSQIDRYIGR